MYGAASPFFRAAGIDLMSPVPVVRAAVSCLAFALVAEAPAAVSAEDHLQVLLAAPLPGATFGGEDGRAFVSGRVLSRSGRPETFDVAIVIDTSYSTSAPSGADVDGDGRTGKRLIEQALPLGWVLPFGNTDAGDSILAAEIEAAQTLLDQLDPRTTRVGVIAFSGDAREKTADARTVVPLTPRYRAVRNGLRMLLEEGPHGRTNMYDAVQVATRELGGFDDAISVPRSDPEEGTRVMLFMTDGHPTLPVSRAPMENARLAIEAARRARSFDIRIDTFAIGRSATDEPVVTVEMAAATDGLFTPVKEPRDLVAVFEHVRLTRIEEVAVRNTTTSTDADHVIVDADGGFSAVVDLADGENWLEVRATDSDGLEGVLRVPVTRVPRAGVQRLSPRLEARRLRLLESQLAKLRRRNVEIKLERDQGLRRQLEIEIARGRELQQRSRSLEVAIEFD